MARCKLSVTADMPTSASPLYSVCALSKKIRCDGMDDDKEQCPFWKRGRIT
jgi:hypothetical protein